MAAWLARRREPAERRRLKPAGGRVFPTGGGAMLFFEGDGEMQSVIQWIGTGLGAVMDVCYSICKNYGLAIILFTLVSKIILLPLTIWVHYNGLKMVRMMPAINWLHVNHYGDRDAIAEGQAKLYKQEKYSPLAGLLPIIVQLILLLGLVEVIRNLIARGNSQELMFLGINLGWVPSEKGGISILVPILAALSSLVMTVTQNRSQALQAEQGKINKYSMLVISVGLSLYLGLFVSAGIGLYWIASNLFSVIQMYLLNWAIPPRKHVNYEELEKSRAALAEIEALDGGKKKGLFSHDEHAKQEKADYKRFFTTAGKHVVFYSEKSGFWKYFKDIIDNLLAWSNLPIHYVTNDPGDRVFELAKTEPRIVPYYIGPKKIIPLMMKMDADTVVMTTPDLENFHIKRSYVRKDTEYIYAPHDCMSMHMGFREGCMDHFDTILCTGPQQMEEIRKTEEIRGTKQKTLVPCGYCLLDDMAEDWEKRKAEAAAPKDGLTRILIAPSWNEDNILDSCIDELLKNLLREDRKITVRPHPEYVKMKSPQMNALMDRWKAQTGEKLVFETDFSSNQSLYEADILITDWSGIAYEYSYTTGKPTLFINTKIKLQNPNWEKVGITPMEISLRDQIGRSLEKNQLDQADGVIAEMAEHPEEWAERIKGVKEKNVFNPGGAGKAAAEYILNSLIERDQAAGSGESNS